MLRNTISAAAGVYTDSSAPSATRGDPFVKVKAIAKPLQAGPPRVNRLRNAYAHAGGQAANTDLARPSGAPSLPEPGMDDAEGDGSLNRGQLDGLGSEGSGPNAEDPLALRREGRRIPRMADTVAHLATSAAPKPTRALAPHYCYYGNAMPSAPLALPGESDSDGEGQQKYYCKDAPPPPATSASSQAKMEVPVFARMPNGSPVPPISPTPPSFLLNKPQSATSPHLPTMTSLPPPPVRPVPPLFAHSVVAASAPPASPDTAVSSVSPPPRIASPAASTTNKSRPDNSESMKHSFDDSNVTAPVVEAAPATSGETEKATPPGTGKPCRSGGQLRRVILPEKLISYFTDVVAEANTARKIETCGLLLGKEVRFWRDFFFFTLWFSSLI